MCGLIPVAAMRLCWATHRLICMLKGLTSIAAGFNHPCCTAAVKGHGNGHAPYKNVLTHGFVLDDKGYKLSKSKSDTLTLPQIMTEHGTDVLRLWVALADTSEDMKLGHQSLTHAKDCYRRFRNCLRFLLGDASPS